MMFNGTKENKEILDKGPENSKLTFSLNKETGYLMANILENRPMYTDPNRDNNMGENPIKTLVIF